MCVDDAQYCIVLGGRMHSVVGRTKVWPAKEVSVVVFAEPESGDAVEHFPGPFVVGALQVLRGLPYPAVEVVLGLLVRAAAGDGAAQGLDPLIDDLVLDVVVEVVHGGVLVDVVVPEVEAGMGELVYALQSADEADVAHVHGGAVLAPHGLLGAVAGGVDDAVPVAEEDDLGAGVLHPGVVRGVAELHFLDDCVLIQEFDGRLERPVAELLPEGYLAFGHVEEDELKVEKGLKGRLGSCPRRQGPPC